ncbi:MAG TPA: DNA-directed RNA polymerase subunit beta', partial [Spirochaeta sp.]|nr:DNA-directed RNA polymerase subunit beta' [Spirochaeta sp.]
LNRAPTLHRLGIQAFEPVLVQGKAIKLHPLVCHAYNADFDGDQMAVHVPLTQAAQIECWTLMLSVNNLLNPASGSPVVFPSQDMVLGINYLTRNRPGAPGEGKWFGSGDEIILAREAGAVDFQALCKVKVDGEYIETTAGRIIFNKAMPPEIEFVNWSLGDKELRVLIAETIKKHGPSITVKMLDAIKDTGFRYATVFGATISMQDIVIPGEKKEMIETANSEVSVIQEQYQQGHITTEERYNRVVEVWSKTNEDLTNVLMTTLKADRAGFNPVWMMADSGARGSRTQIRQLSGMRGLMAKPSGDIIELPIRSNFKEGLSIIEFFISTNGARKGLADTALKTADAGYLTRRLVDIAQDVVTNEDDCGTINGIEIRAIKDGEEVVESLSDRIQGRFTLERVKHPITGEIMVDVNQYINDDIAVAIEEAGVESVRIRTVLTCEAEHGVCRKCYGRNLANNKTVEIGEAVGIIAAQSIGQPGTQLTMRTFHIGGAATKVSEENRTYLRYPSLIKEINGTTVTLENGDVLYTRKGNVIIAKVLQQLPIAKSGKAIVESGVKVVPGDDVVKNGSDVLKAEEIGFVQVLKEQVVIVAQDQKIDIRTGAKLMVGVGSVVPAEESIAVFDPFSEPIIAEVEGTIVYKDIILGTTLKEEINEDTGNVDKKITEHSLETLQPMLLVVGDDGEELASYYLPGNAYLNVDDGAKVNIGKTLAKLLKESVKTRDITGGLPRVGELFEARKPKNPTVLAKISGTIHLKGIVKGKRVVEIEDDFAQIDGKDAVIYKHLVPMGKHLLVRDGDLVEAGEPLCDGAVDPHDILDILGENELQSYLVDEVQEVYRMQGVVINDKHIGVIVRQMMRKVEIRQVGDTNFIYGQQVDKYKFHLENKKVMREGGEPAVARPLLLGITRASLNIDSFLSAASFQETTKVLTNAAIAGSVDNLRGLKENVIIGHPIPAGTGMRSYKNVRLFDDTSEDLDASIAKILEIRKAEKAAEEAEGDEDGKEQNLSLAKTGINQALSEAGIFSDSAPSESRPAEDNPAE